MIRVHLFFNILIIDNKLMILTWH